MRNINPGVPIAIHAMEIGIRRLERPDLDAEERYRILYYAKACQNAMYLAVEGGELSGEWKRLDGLISYIIQAIETPEMRRKSRQAMH